MKRFVLILLCSVFITSTFTECSDVVYKNGVYNKKAAQRRYKKRKEKVFAVPTDRKQPRSIGW